MVTRRPGLSRTVSVLSFVSHDPADFNSPIVLSQIYPGPVFFFNNKLHMAEDRFSWHMTAQTPGRGQTELSRISVLLIDDDNIVFNVVGVFF